MLSLVCVLALAPQVPVSEHVVVTATVAPSEHRSLGRAVTVITREDIDRLTGAAVVDLLRLAPGLDVRARGEHGVQADFLIRGGGFGQTLVLIDGLRMNNAQSGHHNADVPITSAALERIEIVPGAASAAHGADALGGTVHLISRAGRFAEATVEGGSFGTARLEAAAGVAPAALSAAVWASRSSGFMFDRDHGLGGARVSASPRAGVRVSAAHGRKAFGANGFYGPSPSKEWTDMTVVSGSAARHTGAWTLDARGAYRNHGDRFRWDIARPGFAENVHRTHGADVTARADYQMTAARVSAGVAAGADWIDSSNLGDHDQTRVALFTEAQIAMGGAAVLHPGLRLDRYSTFGAALSPSLAVSWWPSDRWRARASVGRAFRAPTYTERFYSDPAHLASDALDAEDGWSGEAGLDVIAGGWIVSATAFARADRNVIDWVRASPAERWRTTNVHDVDTQGAELQLTRRFGRGLARVSYTALDVSAPSLALLSKYVLDYTRHGVAAFGAVDFGSGVHGSLRVDHRRRSDGQRYSLADARLTARVGRLQLFIEGTNLLDEEYQEVAGVAMPGRAGVVGVTLTGNVDRKS